MIKGIGTDIIEVMRVEYLLNKYSTHFINKILSTSEISKAKYINANLLAKRFCAKEAISKALGCGIGANLGFHDIEIINDPLSGKPLVKLHNHPNVHIMLSIADEKHYATAFAIALTN